jgi:hypothetical protein
MAKPALDDSRTAIHNNLQQIATRSPQEGKTAKKPVVEHTGSGT